MGVRTDIERGRCHYDSITGRYDEYVGNFEKLFIGDGRQWVCAQVAGNVLEIGIGTGRNLPYYPPHVTLTDVELTTAMLDFARRTRSPPRPLWPLQRCRTTAEAHALILRFGVAPSHETG